MRQDALKQIEGGDAERCGESRHREAFRRGEAHGEAALAEDAARAFAAESTARLTAKPRSRWRGNRA